jgi:hypothetical protein
LRNFLHYNGHPSPNHGCPSFVKMHIISSKNIPLLDL